MFYKASITALLLFMVLKADTTYVETNSNLTNFFDRFDNSWEGYYTKGINFKRDQDTKSLNFMAIKRKRKKIVYICLKSLQKFNSVKILLSNGAVFKASFKGNKARISNKYLKLFKIYPITAIRLSGEFYQQDYDIDSTQELSLVEVVSSLSYSLEHRHKKVKNSEFNGSMLSEK